MKTVVLPDIPKSLQSKFLEGIESQRLRAMPNSTLPPSKSSVKGLFLAGDAMNMRHPLTGGIWRTWSVHSSHRLLRDVCAGGMTVALWDAVHLRELLAPPVVPSLANTDLVHRQMRKMYSRRKARAATINILASALYALYSAGDGNRGSHSAGAVHTHGGSRLCRR
jgi:squalene monooxygenase